MKRGVLFFVIFVLINTILSAEVYSTDAFIGFDDPAEAQEVTLEYVLQKCTEYQYIEIEFSEDESDFLTEDDIDNGVFYELYHSDDYISLATPYACLDIWFWDTDGENEFATSAQVRVKATLNNAIKKLFQITN